MKEKKRFKRNDAVALELYKFNVMKNTAIRSVCGDPPRLPGPAKYILAYPCCLKNYAGAFLLYIIIPHEAYASALGYYIN